MSEIGACAFAAPPPSSYGPDAALEHVKALFYVSPPPALPPHTPGTMHWRSTMHVVACRALAPNPACACPDSAPPARAGLGGGRGAADRCLQQAGAPGAVQGWSVPQPPIPPKLPFPRRALAQRGCTLRSRRRIGASAAWSGAARMQQPQEDSALSSLPPVDDCACTRRAARACRARWARCATSSATWPRAARRCTNWS